MLQLGYIPTILDTDNTVVSILVDWEMDSKVHHLQWKMTATGTELIWVLNTELQQQETGIKRGRIIDMLYNLTL